MTEIKKLIQEDWIQLLKNCRKLQNIDKNKTQEHRLKIAVLGSVSTQYIVLVLKYLLSIENINAEIYEGEYQSIFSETLDENSNFYNFHPSIVILLPYHLDIHDFPDLMSESKEIDEWVDKYQKQYSEIWQKIYFKLKNIQIFQANFVIPLERQMGHLEANYYFSIRNCFILLNLSLLKKHPSYVKIIDIEYLAAAIGKENWFDYSSYYLNKMPFNMKYIGRYVEVFVQNIAASIGQIKKCLVLDLDNTLWGGVVGDEGWNGIQLDSNNALGEAFTAFQKYIKSLKERGVILAVCSKNNEAIAREVFEKNENMILHLDDISCFIANYEDKATNLIEIAKRLNISLDSIVFFDDNPSERDIVQRFLPQVYVIDVPEDPALYSYALNKENPFEWLIITKEDLERSNSYIENQKRNELVNTFVDYNDYLKALNMEGIIDFITDMDISRYVQLINKSNQFNLRTKRYTDAEITHKMKEENYFLYSVKLKDRYSNYGLISCIILEKKGKLLFIDTWLMSCRVLKRGVEQFVFDFILKWAREQGFEYFVGEYIPTEKNQLVSEFYPELGFYEDKSGKYIEYKTKENSKLYVYEIKNNFQGIYYIKND